MHKNFDEILESNISKIQELASTVNSLSSICKNLGYSAHGRNTNKLSKFMQINNIVFKNYIPFGNVSPKEERICPECSNKFIVSLTNSKQKNKITCGHKCANKYFSWKQGPKDKCINSTNYRYYYLKFLNSKNKEFCCVHCRENNSLILEVHHIDNDRNNNSFDNLVTLCTLHHRMLHQNLQSNEIIESIINYLDSI